MLSRKRIVPLQAVTGGHQGKDWLRYASHAGGCHSQPIKPAAPRHVKRGPPKKRRKLATPWSPLLLSIQMASSLSINDCPPTFIPLFRHPPAPHLPTPCRNLGTALTAGYENGSCKCGVTKSHQNARGFSIQNTYHDAVGNIYQVCQGRKRKLPLLLTSHCPEIFTCMQSKARRSDELFNRMEGD